ncbi:THO complex subunit 4A [Argentina anserina]|uniref:THO complex subunit 4A n=1 Tax=Argentina anserina TaxID=57926 RepID=UPI00217678C1|nr:THO complex subunit 4A [Potentilla anserina]
MDHLNMSLDDIIKTSKKPGSGNNRGGRGRAPSGPGPARRLPNRAGNRATPYGAAKAPEDTWQHDMYSDQGAAYGAPAGRASAIETGTKLYISNLDYGVSNEDIKELFAEVGDLKRYGVHYDRSGRSKGTADVVFSRRQDAMSAVKRYNNVMLDGKPMKIEIVGTNISTPGAPSAVPPPPANGVYRNPNGAPRGGQGRGGAFGRPRGGAGGGGRGPRRGRGGRGRGGRTGEKVSAEDLDAELEKYHATAETMQE